MALSSVAAASVDLLELISPVVLAYDPLVLNDATSL
jgi:hypothetical protein